ncbi:hypothetical protein [Streptomyces fulvoviolaceus]|uniref:hypothetical protein n=1 Tax=Streptomyces fulvoviolaceus TaxID=285535 RepID=UPI00069398E6|nr:hypothetical protein [Streptomyces fulvoviolaceus]
MAAALVLGAAGALAGSRFQATAEAREAELAAYPDDARQAYRADQSRGRISPLPVWAARPST